MKAWRSVVKATPRLRGPAILAHTNVCRDVVERRRTVTSR
jgi:hypothetical protein